MLSESHVRTLLVLNVLFFLSLVLFCGTAIFAARTLSTARANYDITERVFFEAVAAGISNYLDNALSPGTSSFSEAPSSLPAKLPIFEMADFGTAATFSGIPYLIIDGERYFVGDYSEYGLIARILPDRFYARRGDDDVVIRRSRRVVSALPRGDFESQGNAETTGGAEEKKGSIFSRVF